MPRQPRPWRRSGEGGDWYAQVDGKKVRLAPASATKTEAQATLTAILAAHRKEDRAPCGTFRTREALALFLAHVEKRVAEDEMAATTLEGYERYLFRAEAHLGTIPIPSLRPADVQAWINEQANWGPTSRFNAITAIKAALSWCKTQGHIRENPIADMPRPRPARREAILSDEQYRRIIEATPDREFRWFLEALRRTGCRPGEVAGLTADRVDLEGGTWSVRNKTRHKTGERHRRVYLCDRMIEMSRELVQEHPDGFLFRNLNGTAWTRHTIAHRLERLAAGLGIGKEAVAYSLRHLYITDALEKGISPTTVAELVGHVDATMILRVYSHLAERTAHLREAARKVQS